MKKLINDPANYVDESLEGMVVAHPHHYALTGRNRRVVSRSIPKSAGKVGIASGGGFGHLPLFAGYVGQGLLDACAVGNVFAGPALEDVADALSASDHGAGVLNIVGNYGGDRMVFGTANDMFELEGKQVETILVADDVASAPLERAETRRGVAGVVLAYKVAGAAAEQGRSLSDVATITRRALGSCRSVGVALTSCTIPTAGMPTFDIPADAIELGMGIHGEQGLWRGPNKPVDEIADELTRLLLEDIGPEKGSRMAVLGYVETDEPNEVLTYDASLTA
jgi:dihydroxyacetone kinase-like protein